MPNNSQSVQRIEREMRDAVLSYIECEHLGKSPELRDRCKETLRKTGVLFQDPYYEATPAYESVPDGLANANIPPTAKDFLVQLSKRGKGVFNSPYRHQLDAIEHFWKGCDLIVSSGTGSGKTECFMWPLISKLAYEAAESPASWDEHAVRAIVLYPMNALVNDQLGRLRKTLGGQPDEFRGIWSAGHKRGRRPQFGMYTGKTQYAGEEMERSKTREFVKTMRDDLVNINPLDIETLKREGKYPQKCDLEAFLNQMENGQIGWSERDAELITRFEMQQFPPDVLITNYSMLQRMLIRRVESPIWQSTRTWLHTSPNNKLLLIIDEAHMYRGASGGEVGLLIRRLADTLDIDVDSFQIIMTSASLPDAEATGRRFFTDLTGKDAQGLKILRGSTVEPRTADGQDVPASEFTADTLESTLSASDDDTADQLYRTLPTLLPFQRLNKAIRGNCRNLAELAERVFPSERDADCRIEATGNLIDLLALARSKKDEILIPIRMHMFFRNIQSLSACSNPQCTCNTHKDALSLGSIKINAPLDRCTCGAKTYELQHDDACGAIFLRGYVEDLSSSEFYFWSEPSQSDDMIQALIYVVPRGEEVELDSKLEQVGYLNPFTGKIVFDDTHADDDGYLRVICETPESYKKRKGRKKKRRDGACPSMPRHCPKCGRELNVLSSFGSRYDLSFYHAISKQFELQQRSTDKDALAKNPKAGKKVILFSDSRSMAANLAIDLSETSEQEVGLRLVACAAHMLETELDDPSIEKVQTAYYLLAQRLGGSTLPSNSMELIERRLSKEDIEDWGENYLLDKCSVNNERAEFYNRILLKSLCGPESLTDAAIGWARPTETMHRVALKNINKALNELGVDSWQDSDFDEIFHAWSQYVLKNRVGFELENMNLEDRKSIRPYLREFGIDRHAFEGQAEGPRSLKRVLENRYGVEAAQKIEDVLLKRFTTEKDNGRSYLKADAITLHIEPDANWRYCKRCHAITPLALFGHCPCCKTGELIPFKGNFSSIDNVRRPIIEALNGNDAPLRQYINTEEHSAQLSYKDAKSKSWSTTEQYEMRFQDIFFNGNTTPVDILSCTTTMEVGIDIGSLTAVAMRNIPPRRENYQQRAGRAGRRGSALSTILTFVEDRPFDVAYFNNPADIVRGSLPEPKIDVVNDKLVRRHLACLALTRFAMRRGFSPDTLPLGDYFEQEHDEFLAFLNTPVLDASELERVLPGNPTGSECIEKESNFRKKLTDDLDGLKADFEKHREQFLDIRKKQTEDNPKYINLLDALLNRAILPTYSFAVDVVGFDIETRSGKELEQRPERAIDLAISEYAPGQEIVVNKKRYISGGIYSHASRQFASNQNAPARSYFDSPDYFREMYHCQAKGCGWFGTKEDLGPKGTCPFCGAETDAHEVLKPWGFAPKGGREKQADDVDTISFSAMPVYSATPNNPMQIAAGKHLKYDYRKDCVLHVENQGPFHEGFTVCQECGAAVPTNQDSGASSLYKPYNGGKNTCVHKFKRGIYLGCSLNSDLVLFQIELKQDEVCVTPENPWLKKACISLGEALRLSAAKMLDIELKEFNAGYRIRHTDTTVFADIFLFDDLSSGAGYSSMINSPDMVQKLFSTARTLLEDCSCDNSCLSCLRHYGNKRLHKQLDRHAALDLCAYALEGTIQSTTVNSGPKLFKPLFEELRQSEEGLNFTCKNNRAHIAATNGNSADVVAIPNMVPKSKTHEGEYWEFELDQSIPTIAETLYDRLLW